jgi:hypothetical protein
MVNPVPDKLAWEIVTLDVPVLVTVSVIEAVLPT